MGLCLPVRDIIIAVRIYICNRAKSSFVLPTKLNKWSASPEMAFHGSRILLTTINRTWRIMGEIILPIVLISLHQIYYNSIFTNRRSPDTNPTSRDIIIFKSCEKKLQKSQSSSKKRTSETGNMHQMKGLKSQ